jgi:phosphatidate cytidylyltransferase
MKDLTHRVVASTIFIAILACLIVFALGPFFQYVVAAIVALLTAVALWEYGQLAMAKGGQMVLPVLIIAAVFQVLSFFCAATLDGLESLPSLIFFLSMIALFALHFKENEGAVVDLAVSSFGLLYIAVPMGMVLGILYFGNGEDGRWWVAYLLAVTKISDIGAYFGGKLWGRRKLAPTISPGKTVEGAISGLICSLLSSYAFHLLSDSLGAARFHLGTLEWFCLGLILGLVGQFGDLSESLLKRDANKKDSNALPGLGGALDSIDSLLFNSAIVYFYLNNFKL